MQFLIRSNLTERFSKVITYDISALLSNEECSFFSLHPFFSEEKFDLEQGLTILTDKLQGAKDHIAPENTENPRRSLPTWITTEIRLLRSKRNATGRRYDRMDSNSCCRSSLSWQNHQRTGPR